MATILLAAAGASLGAGFSGSILGLTGAVIGRAVGASIGQAIDQRILGSGSAPVEVGRRDRFHIMGANEGTALARVWGRMRIPGHVIWSSPFTESATTSGGGKGGSPTPQTTQYSYSVSLALALGEGEILGVGRVWADGEEISVANIDMRVYHGTQDQRPDSAIEAIEGAQNAPAYRGTAYVVFENLPLAPYGNRVPQFSFEVLRKAQSTGPNDLQSAINAVAVIPGTGEYALATTPALVEVGFADTQNRNVNTRGEKTDFAHSLDQLRQELPNCSAASLVVSWFGDDLRCGTCKVRPKVENATGDAAGMPWRAGGITRSAAQVLPKINGRAIYGGTPTDQSVIEAIRAMRANGQRVMFYPFVLMEQLAGNTLPNPYSGSAGQPVFPWRGRITTSRAPGVNGSPDGTAAAASEVASFFGGAQPNHFSVSGSTISYSGPQDWGYRRFILHYAHLCKAAGGVESFCIGSELRGLTHIRGAAHSFPAVAQLIALAADVRTILGADVKLSYAADWSEYFGYHINGDVYFHLDPLWANDNIDFIGIDNYMPLSDWRDTADHVDSSWPSIYDLDYLKANIAGGEGFDWYYSSTERRAAQLRSPIEDGAHNEPWVFRYKDLRSWWSLPHHNRINGTRLSTQSAWIPGSKPIRFTEYGCPAVDKGTNEPNKFVDPKSSESSLPRHSNGQADDYIQMQYFRAMALYWNDEKNNPNASLYQGKMLDFEHCYAWAWDGRPYPDFPRNDDLWSDGENYRLGHWLNGRATSQPLENILREVAVISGVESPDTSRVHGLVRGYSVQDISTARSAMQPLAMVYSFDPIEANGQISFVSRFVQRDIKVDAASFALSQNDDDARENTRLPDADIVGRTRLGFISADGSFEGRVTEAVFPGANTLNASTADFSIALTSGQAKAVAERWLAEANTSRDMLKLRLPPSRADVAPGALITYGDLKYRVDRVEVDDARNIEAVRIEPSHYGMSEAELTLPKWNGYTPQPPITPLFLDLPDLSQSGSARPPLIAATAKKWPGSVAIWAADEDAGYQLNTLMNTRAIIGKTETPLLAAQPGVIDNGSALRVRLVSGTLSSATNTSFLSGVNAAAIGDGTPDNWEIFQFQTAKLVAQDTYDLTRRLRGQLGSDGIMPQAWPRGSYFVLLDNSPTSIDLPTAYNRVARHYRIGPADQNYTASSINHKVQAFNVNSLRPYPVAHLRTTPRSDGGLNITWIRRGRNNADQWEPAEIPLSEEREQYQLSIISNIGQTKRSIIVDQPSFVYSASMQTSDTITAPFSIRVAQLSNSYGSGPIRSITVT